MNFYPNSESIHKLYLAATVVLFTFGIPALWMKMESVRLWASTPEGIVVLREVVAIGCLSGLFLVIVGMIAVWFD